MAHVSRKLSTAFEGALAGGGDPATSPLYVFGPFLRLIVVGGVAQITFGVSVWLVVITIAMVSAMYRLVMIWITDGSGGSGLNEEEFGSWAVKVNAGITFVEYTLTFLVSMAALVTFIADRLPVLNNLFLGIQLRAYIAIILSIFTGWLVNRGPKIAARAFGPATAGVLLLLWIMIISTIWQFGFHLPDFNLQAFSHENLRFTLGGYSRILAVMTGIEIFANLVPAYHGRPSEKSRKAFNSLIIIMGTTGFTMLIVGPAIFQLSDPTDPHVSVFTQTMDLLLPAPLPWLGTLVGVAVLLSASAASAQGLQNLALGLKYRNYLPNFIGQRNQFNVADKPVWLEVLLVSICFLIFGTSEETYLAIYAAGVFILLSMTGWAAAKRLLRQFRNQHSVGGMLLLAGTGLAAMLTSSATIIIFEERFLEGAWTYLLFLPVLYLLFTWFRKHLGDPTPAEERLGQMIGERKYLRPFLGVESDRKAQTQFENIVVPLDGSTFAEQPLSLVQAFGRAYNTQITLVSIVPHAGRKLPRLVPQRSTPQISYKNHEIELYLDHLVTDFRNKGVSAGFSIGIGPVAQQIDALAQDSHADLIVMSTHGRSGVERWLIGSVANKLIMNTTTPMLLIRPTSEWRSRWSQFKRLLITLDGSTTAERVLGYSCSLAKQFNSEIILLSVPENVESNPAYKPSIAQYLESVQSLLKAEGITAQAIITGIDPASTIVEISQSEKIDLIMMATQGLGGLDRFMIGSVADRVLRHTYCPIFLVPAR
jgi:nucleotide-binding universal stress UspA family protein